jgi:glutamate formiminotransferase
MAGYFQPTAAADGSVGWMGGTQQADLAAYPPDLGPATASAAAGVVTVGAVPWVVNYNVPLYTDDMAAARRVAKVVSARGGGLAGVEVSMVVRHSEALPATALVLLLLLL